MPTAMNDDERLAEPGADSPDQRRGQERERDFGEWITQGHGVRIASVI
jgi:hypothetical protein